MQRERYESDYKMEINRIMAEKSLMNGKPANSYLHQMYVSYKKLRDHSTIEQQQLEEYSFRFRGEPGVDAGGLRREYLRLMSKQLIEEFKMFIPSPNSVFNMAIERDKMVPNPAFVTEAQLEMFNMFGYAMSMLFKSGGIVTINLPSVFWRFMLKPQLCWEDIKCVDTSIFNCLNSIKEMKDDELEYLDTRFVMSLFDGRKVELKPDGGSIQLNASNRIEYLNLFKKRYLGQLLPAFERMRAGFFDFLSSHKLKYLNADQLEKIMCGVNFVNLDHLKSITIYEGFDENEEHEDTKRFWRVLETFTQEQLSGYI